MNLRLSKRFMAGHPRKGEDTGFAAKVLNEVKFDRVYISLDESPSTKRHTCRESFEYWDGVIRNVNAGKYPLILCSWIGEPFKSGVEHIITLDKTSGIGVQALEFYAENIEFPFVNDGGRCIPINWKTLAENDGLTPEDFKAWFAGADLSKTFAIIHFTAFRYK